MKEIYAHTMENIGELIQSENLKFQGSLISKPENSTNKFKAQMLHSKLNYFEKLPQKAEALFIERFKAIFNPNDIPNIKANLDAVVAQRDVVKIDGHSLTLSEMEIQGYFNEQGNIEEDFKKVIDGRCLDKDNYPNATSDKERIIMSSLVFAVNAEVIADMKNDLSELMNEIISHPSMTLMQINARITTLESSSEAIKNYINTFNLTEKLSKLEPDPTSSPRPF